MSVATLIEQARACGVRLWAEGDRLRAAPPGMLDEELREQIKARRGELLEVLRALPPDLALADRGVGRTATLSARGREALGKASGQAQPGAGYVTPSRAGAPQLDQCRIGMHAEPIGLFLLVRDARALEALDLECPAIPVLYFHELERRRAKELGAEGLRVLLAARSVYGPGVELRRVTRTRADG